MNRIAVLEVTLVLTREEARAVDELLEAAQARRGFRAAPEVFDEIRRRLVEARAASMAAGRKGTTQPHLEGTRP